MLISFPTGERKEDEILGGSFHGDLRPLAVGLVQSTERDLLRLLAEVCFINAEVMLTFDPWSFRTFGGRGGGRDDTQTSAFTYVVLTCPTGHEGDCPEEKTEQPPCSFERTYPYLRPLLLLSEL